MKTGDLSQWIADLGSGIAGADPSLVGAEQVQIKVQVQVQIQVQLKDQVQVHVQIKVQVHPRYNDISTMSSLYDPIMFFHPQWGQWEEAMMKGGVLLTKVRN